MKKWVKGDPRFSVVQDGKTYLFPGEEQRQMFVKNPDKYTPALGGKCTVCQVEMGKDVEGTVHFAAIHQGRLFLFPGDEQKQMFLKNPSKYAGVDLAADGKCTVCRVEMQKDVQGKPEFAVIHNGLRYRFPSEEQRQMFIANPSKYEIR
jgi:YHS domain-containing protein